MQGGKARSWFILKFMTNFNLKKQSFSYVILIKYMFKNPQPYQILVFMAHFVQFTQKIYVVYIIIFGGFQGFPEML